MNNEPEFQLLPREDGQTVDIAWRKWPDGREESVLVTSPEFKRWRDAFYGTLNDA